MKTKTVTYNNKSINYSSQGSGPAIVFLHGFLESITIWENFMSNLSARFTVVAIDLPGHGQSAIWEKEHTMDFMAGIVNTVLEQLNISECLMAGHSMGGYVTLAFADRFEDKLKGIVLLNSHAASDSDEAKQNRTRTINLVKKDRIGFISSFIPDLFSQANVGRLSKVIEKHREIAYNTPAEGIIAALKGMKSRNDHRLLLENINIPVMIIAGKEDKRIPEGMIMTQAGLPRHTELILLAEVGHMAFIEAEEITLQIIRDFATRILK